MSVIIDGYEVDAALSEQHSFDSEVTAHPVETGADISDHIRAMPITVTLDCVVSDTPVGVLSTRRDNTTLPSEDAFSLMLAIRDLREPVTIETSLRDFPDMALQKLSMPRSSRDGDSLRFQATFVQVKTVTSTRATVRVDVPRGKKKSTLGFKPAPEVSRPTGEGGVGLLPSAPASVAPGLFGGGPSMPSVKADENASALASWLM